MTWPHADDKDVTNSRLISVSVEARWLWWMVQVYICADGPDGPLFAQGGQFSEQVLRSVAGVQQMQHADKLAAELVEAGLWRRTDEGYFDPDWTRRNWTRERKAEWDRDHA